MVIDKKLLVRNRNNNSTRTIIERHYLHHYSSAGLTIAFAICFISILFTGISSMFMLVYLPVIVKELLGTVSDEKINNVSAYINFIFIFGSMFDGFAWGVICDKIGRSKAVTLSTGLNGLFTILTAFSSSWLMVGVYRFVTGFGVGSVLLTTNVLLAELWPEKKRTMALYRRRCRLGLLLPAI